jgi:glyoxylase-like metal-dependent hydrolase (beta-lactamase superfamily II)
VKLACDVLLGGSAFGSDAPGNAASTRLDASLRLGEVLELTFAAVAPSPVLRLPLTAGYLRASDGVTPLPPVGPIRGREVEATSPSTSFEELDPEDREAVLAELRARFEALESPAHASESPVAEMPSRDDDEPTWDELGRAPWLEERGVQHAAAHQTTPYLAGGETLVVAGLLPGGGVRAFELPDHAPLVVADGPSGRFVLDMRCDTLLLDDEGLSLTWRGQVPADLFASPTSSVVVCLARRGQEPTLAAVMGELARAHVARAVVPEEAALPLPPTPDVELAAQRTRWSFTTPSPRLAVEAYAALRAQLAARSGERVDLLAAHGMDEHEWSLEQRAHAARVKRAARRGETETVEAFERTLAEARGKTRTG